MPSSTNRQLTERVDAIDRELAEVQECQRLLGECFGRVFGPAAGPPGLRDEYRPVLSVIQGGQR